ncbi:penicillin-binding transpeptidase domain-containing protein [Streptomonospora litoralis]|uniref:Beta-lactam-inducible penicillin-binding protein n=1 Tax=Streptomonospora litoralis TaxID=2498135 RepID=A0A4P6Q6Y8_9ACTN|nr:penicillin-binding transpeptidase domain-containing protein [Streptomonospora litoralis]QBI54577.1 Beta-lactam-inducible penicillin-binding protein [Streptomonospora litoralis]
MDDDRRPSGPGEPSSPPPAPSGRHDGDANRRLEQDAAPAYGAPAPPEHSEGPPPEAPRPYAPPPSPQWPGAGSAEPPRHPAPEPPQQQPGAHGDGTPAEQWGQAAPSSPYSIPGRGPAGPSHPDRQPPSPPHGPAPSVPQEAPPPYAADHRPPFTPAEGPPAAAPYPPPEGHTPAASHDGPPPYAATGHGYPSVPADDRDPFASSAAGDPFSPPDGPRHTEPQPAVAPAAPPSGAVFTRGGASGPVPVPPETPHAGPGPGGPGGDPFGSDRPVPRRRSRKGLLIGIVSAVVVLALAGGGASWYVLTLPEPEETAAAYVRAWNSQDYAAMTGLADGGDPAAAFKRLDGNLGIEQTRVTTGAVEEVGDGAVVPFEATFTLSNAGEWSYSGELPLVRVEREWKVDFGPGVVHPDLGEGQTLVRTNEWGERGHILAADGSRLDDGTASGSVQMILGEVGTAAEEDLADLGAAYEVGDPVGVSGVQKAYEERLAGEASTAIRVVEAGTAPQDVPEDAPTAGSIEGQDGKDVTLSIDPAVQAAAAQAIIGQSKPTAMVALRPSTGEVLAAANVPGGFNRALDGQYPAGSIFKIISYNALLDSGMGMDAAMNCPKTTEVGGRTYKNAGDAAYGAQTVTEAFATSCNTALVQEVADRLDGASLLASAEQFGFNTGFHSGLPVFKPSLPQPDSVSLLTASSIGQGKVLTSPLHMASLPAAVADGSWRAPMLVTEPAPAERPEPAPIANAQNLRDMTRAVVTEGTAENVGFTGEVHGKSGTAEYGTAAEGEELPAHGWFVGYEGDIAFAVVVEDGQSGSGAAAPLAKSFLDAL